MTACSDSDDDSVALNTTPGVTVSLPSEFTYPDRNPQVTDTMYVQENVGIFNIPLIVTGETNGELIVTVETTMGMAVPPADIIPAEEVTHYVVTEKTVRIPAGAKEGRIEVNSIWPSGVVDPNRTFTIKITKVEGATAVGGPLPVTILNIDDPYTAMMGTWKFTAKDWDDLPVEYTLTMLTAEPGDEDYGTYLYATGFLGHNFGCIPFNFAYDNDTQEISMVIPVGELACTGRINFGSYVGLWVTAGSMTPWGDDIPCYCNAAQDEITFDPESLLVILTADASTGSLKGYWDRFYEMNMVRQ